MADLISLREASERIATGQAMLVAGDASQLAQLPKGQWIGGTTPYFMGPQGGVVDRERVFVTLLGAPIESSSIRIYPPSELPRVIDDYPKHGCSFIILPAGSDTHLRFARECFSWSGLFNAPLVGWNAGVLLSEIAGSLPKVFDGTTLQSFENAAAVLHATTNDEHMARIEIINAFRQGNGDTFTFPRSGFTVTDCLVNGKKWNFADYLKQNAVDTRWPLVADYAGAQINVSFQGIDDIPKQVRLYAPVFEDVAYRLAAPVANLAEFFGREFAAHQVKPAFSCNCILNFLYAELEGKQTGDATGPITFGEIAYVQLNQTLVYVTFERRG
jgi:hypothetical protein